MKTTLLVLTLITTNTLMARERIDSCIVNDTEVTETKVVDEGECQVVNELELTSTIKTYPKMPNIGAISVRYWEGSFVKESIQEVSKSIHYYDICRGVKTITIKKKEYDFFKEHYTLENPNLSPKIDKTYMLAPMTDAEALAAYEKLEAKCNKKRN